MILSGDIFGSLTIREGISDIYGEPVTKYMFPHYTWGYIEKRDTRLSQASVPSLYVGVYRAKMYSIFITTRSLTIREGISLSVSKSGQRDGFPHYTWGYITKKTTKARSSKVPSLYVRVYLSLHCTAHKRWSSLTIREGISNPNPRKLLLLPFPHYTWGYIER